MNYKKCPKCELNYITDNEELCVSCRAEKNKFNYLSSGDPHFSQIVKGRVYGTNSRKIYLQFCQSLNWDINKADQFGWQTPLYAMNADTNRTDDVWFICYPNYDSERLDTVVSDFHVVNLIKDNGDTIIEIVDERIGKSHVANRITFVKTNNGYMFFGVYKIIENGTTRIYKRIANNYPYIIKT